MDNLEIENILFRNFSTKNYFIGCFSSDNIPTHLCYPCCLIVNTDPSYLLGTHWIALYLNNADHAEYYDSFGNWPCLSKGINNYLKKFKFVKYNNLKLQSYNSSSCGRHVIFFLCHRCKGFSFDTIIQKIKTFKNADVGVQAFVRYLQNV